ncbi:lipase 3-like [Episyrphus balteatus]|uniref:lipase 3-like n=1 Tax=Episyrphus balteatus TaxID=286459 RepID=UPI0024851F91|nr:lipase 3-like [Episyrphus balteatus]
MNLSWIVLGTLVSLVASAPEGRKSSVTTESIVKGYGYPFEKFTVQTSDGYKLGLHRIPYSPKQNATGEEAPNTRPVVFLMHGLLSSSADWVVIGPEHNALAFVLSDAGYDVWLGNARGNVYSKKHVLKSPLMKSFWNFDWHEIGMYDLPAMIDQIRTTTGQEKIIYVGHSQGSTSFLVLNSLNHDFKYRIKSAHFLAPLVYTSHSKSPLFQLGTLMGLPNYSPYLTGSMELLPNTKFLELLGKGVCQKTSPVIQVCSSPSYLLGGFDTENLNVDKVPDVIAVNPAGSSVNQVYHFMQVKNSGKFRQFDYGIARNLVKYSSAKPPHYPLDKIDVPIYLYSAQNDYLATEADTERLIKELPATSLKQTYVAPHPKWNHFDFLWGLNVKEQVYDTLVENMAEIQ